MLISTVTTLGPTPGIEYQRIATQPRNCDPTYPDQRRSANNTLLQNKPKLFSEARAAPPLILGLIRATFVPKPAENRHQER